ncbi:alpha/beta hydrolase [Candidatus Stoquefichus massiliensis]|uniref:alpha/beta hydrolase n=1 Tax=Candidatus Stoquefichus massiliensis TaxID=1470350 RepID=UPI00048803B2|nr:hypothetical protein [Candidatus Stoquefichus massiliensis]
MKKKYAIGGAVASTLTASTLTAGMALSNQFAKKMLYREHLTKEDQGDWYKELGAEKVKIKNHKGLYLQAYLIEKENAKRTIICLHALLESAYSLQNSVSYLESVFENENILMVDANAHGLSDGYIRGFGYRDIFDLMYFNTYILQKYGEDHRIIMYGQGMGANTILNTSGLGKLKNVDLIISEGAYDNVYSYLAMRCQREHKVSQLLCGPIIRKVIKNELKTDIKKMDTVQLVKKNKIPTVYVHSKNDKEVPFQKVFPLYNHDASNKLLFPIKEEHLYDLKDKEDSYSLSLIEFMNENI